MGTTRTCDVCGKDCTDNFFELPTAWKVEGFEVICSGDGKEGDDSCASVFDKAMRPIAQRIMKVAQDKMQEEIGQEAKGILCTMEYREEL